LDSPEVVACEGEQRGARLRFGCYLEGR